LNTKEGILKNVIRHLLVQWLP